MRLCRSSAARAVVWLAAVLVPVETLPVVACGCDSGGLGQNVSAGCAGRLACNLGPGSPHPNPLPKGEGTKENGTGRKCCCGRESACTCGLVCRCGQSHRSDPQVPSNPNVLKVKNLAGPGPAVLACRGEGDASEGIAAGRSSCWASPTLVRLSTLCRFLI